MSFIEPVSLRGQHVSLVPLELKHHDDLAWWLQAIAFVLFRIFDIWKPYPIRDLERTVKGGWGVMIDDIVAGFYAYVVFALFIIVVYKGFGYAG